MTMLGTHAVANFPNSRKAIADPGDGSNLGNLINYVSLTTIDARLTAFDPFTYSTTALAGMCYNDKVFALRSVDDRTSISDYHPAQTARTS